MKFVILGILDEKKFISTLIFLVVPLTYSPSFRLDLFQLVCLQIIHSHWEKMPEGIDIVLLFAQKMIIWAFVCRICGIQHLDSELFSCLHCWTFVNSPNTTYDMVLSKQEHKLHEGQRKRYLLTKATKASSQHLQPEGNRLGRWMLMKKKGAF